MDLSTAISRVTDLFSDDSAFGIAQRAKLEALFAEKPPIEGIIERLAVALRAKGGFAFVNPNLTSANCPTVAEPSLEGARLEKCVGPRTFVLAELRRDSRRSATFAEGLLYGLTNPEELTTEWIWCLDQVVVLVGREYALVLGVNVGQCFADFCHVADGGSASRRVLSFPMTEAELAARDAEDADKRNR